jgi:hypothetical protein
MKISSRISHVSRIVVITIIAAIACLSLFSCATAAPASKPAGGEPAVGESSLVLADKPLPPMAIMGAGAMGQDRLVSFFLENSPTADRAKVERMAGYYIDECALEGVNPDVAFVQMCLETGFLRFGGLVTEDMNNFCGLGSIGVGQAGVSFPDEQTGVRAHVQHLKGYATADPLALEVVDPRYKYVNPKGKAPLIQGLSGTWASDTGYGAKLAGLLARLYG